MSNYLAANTNNARSLGNVSTLVGTNVTCLVIVIKKLRRRRRRLKERNGEKEK